MIIIAGLTNQRVLFDFCCVDLYDDAEIRDRTTC